MSEPVVMAWWQNEWVLPPTTHENTAAGYYSDSDMPNKAGGDE